ncbi:unnamed protein product [Rotaria sp. Silwood2]|nr:unnamed protein product [Rotaria sp. Silwood2]CAF4122893.1 unnamed protein product [Rotaria sp. Silwood2]
MFLHIFILFYASFFHNLDPYHLIVGRSYSEGQNCTNATCVNQNTTKTWITTAGVYFIISVICCLKWWSGRPLRSNVSYVALSSNEIHEQEFYPFESGVWSSQYYQYDAWHGPHRLSLSFDSETLKVTGNGLDDIGDYEVEGIYSATTHRMGLTKKYRKGTGDPSQNLGHSVTIQVTWNTNQRHFEGKWFVKTNKYSGENKFQLKFEKSYEAKE